MNKDNKILHIGRIKINYSIISKVWLLQYPSIKKVWFPYQKKENQEKKNQEIVIYLNQKVLYLGYSRDEKYPHS